MRGLERELVQPLSDTGRESAGQAGLSKCLQSGLSLKVGTSSTGIICEPSFFFFVRDRSFPTFTSPFLFVALGISHGLYLLCIHVKMSKETKKGKLFLFPIAF